MPVRELVPTHIRTEFGDVLDSPEFYDVGGADRDLTYVPGFSDMRRARDLTLAAVASGKTPRHEAKLTPLPVNCRWTRTSNTKGEPDGRKQIASGNLGYRAVNKDQIGKVPWLTALPPGATLDADGSIRKGDTILMVTDAANAGRNVARRAAQTQRLGDAAAAAKGGLMDVAGKNRGADPYVKKEG
jgi:hypothetical protein